MYKPERDRVHVGCCSSMNRVFDLMARIGYTKVTLFGFDGTAEYYYDDKEKVPEGPIVGGEAMFRDFGRAAGRDATMARPGQDGHPSHGQQLERFLAAFAGFNGIELVVATGGGQQGGWGIRRLPVARAVLELS